MRLASAPMRQSVGMTSGFESEPSRHGFPKHRELPGLAHQDLVAGRQRVRKACLPRARSRRGIDDDGPCVLKRRLDARQHAAPELLRTRARDDRASDATWPRGCAPAPASAPGSAGNGGQGGDALSSLCSPRVLFVSSPACPSTEPSPAQLAGTPNLREPLRFLSLPYQRFGKNFSAIFSKLATSPGLQLCMA